MPRLTVREKDRAQLWIQQKQLVRFTANTVQTSVDGTYQEEASRIGTFLLIPLDRILAEGRPDDQTSPGVGWGIGSVIEGDQMARVGILLNRLGRSLAKTGLLRTGPRMGRNQKRAQRILSRPRSSREFWFAALDCPASLHYVFDPQCVAAMASDSIFSHTLTSF